MGCFFSILFIAPLVEECGNCDNFPDACLPPIPKRRYSLSRIILLYPLRLDVMCFFFRFLLQNLEVSVFVCTFAKLIKR